MAQYSSAAVVDVRQTTADAAGVPPQAPGLGPQHNIRVLLVDDHPVVREGLQTMLSAEQGIEVLGGASSGEEALHQTDELAPDVVLMDILMPGMGGIEATRRIKQAHPAISVIMLTLYNSEMYVVEAIRAGAAGYLVKDASRELICHTIRTVADGGTLIRSGLLRLAVKGLRRRPQDMGKGVDSSVVGGLTLRELDVLKLLAKGYANKDICAELYLAEVTVKKHVQSIISKLGVSDRTQAAVLGVRLGLAE